jgi:multiple sugar transport system ATP-binding protein
VLGIRPEGFEDASFADPALPRAEVDVAVVEDLGCDAHVIFPVDAPPVDTDELREARAADEDAALIAGQGTTFTARVDPRTEAAPGRPLRLAVDPARFHFFDPATGASIDSKARIPESADRPPAPVGASG